MCIDLQFALILETDKSVNYFFDLIALLELRLGRVTWGHFLPEVAYRFSVEEKNRNEALTDPIWAPQDSWFQYSLSNARIVPSVALLAYHNSLIF